MNFKNVTSPSGTFDPLQLVCVERRKMNESGFDVDARADISFCYR